MKEEECMVKIQNGCLRYGVKDTVLNGLNLNVKKNEIYGLLGPSGCGKTTILRCILGQTRLDSGEIYVGVNQHKDIGYMPQEVALFPEFTIKEIFIFYGRLFGLSYDKINEKKKILCNLLELPNWNSKIGSLSGGEQRRTSFAVALLHDTKLLILDEPTVGVDSLLAHSMWEYLVRLTSQGKTIIITTHYIEEAKNCNRISLMRRGVLLSECPPRELLAIHNCKTLEDAFLILCQQQENEITVNSTGFNMKTKVKPPFQNTEWFNKHRFTAQLIKNACWMKRNIPIMFFLLLLPALQSFLFCASFGQDPQELNVAFLSEEPFVNKNLSQCYNPFLSNYTVYTDSELECEFPYPFTCEYVRELEKKMKLIPYTNMDKAKADIVRNQVWGVVYIPKNFTESLIKKMKNNFFMYDQNLEFQTILVRMDMSNYIIGNLLKRQISESLVNALRTFLDKCGYPPKVSSLPIKMHDAIYGSNNPVYAHSGLPGFICSFCFYFTMMFTSGAVMMEKVIGLLERSIVSGMTYIEIVGAHLVVQFLLMAAQTIIMLFVFYICYSNPFLGNIALIIALLFAIEIVGIAWGFLLTEIFVTDRMVSYAGIGSTLAVFSLGGIIWPMEGAHFLIKSWVWAFPVAPAVDSYLSITSKGFTMSHQTVYHGFISCLFWSIIFSSLTILIAKVKKIHNLSIILENVLIRYCKFLKLKNK